MPIEARKIFDFYSLPDPDSAVRRYFAQPVHIENVGSQAVDVRFPGGVVVTLRPGERASATLGDAYFILGDPWSKGDYRVQSELQAKAGQNAIEIVLATEDLNRYHQAATAGLGELAERILPKSNSMPQLAVYDSDGQLLDWPWPVYHPDEPKTPEPGDVLQRIERLEAEVVNRDSGADELRRPERRKSGRSKKVKVKQDEPIVVGDTVDKSEG